MVLILPEALRAGEGIAKTPSPGGPVPLPYPTTTTDKKTLGDKTELKVPADANAAMGPSVSRQRLDARIKQPPSR